IRSYNPLEVLQLPVPDKLQMIILHPLIELHTRDSRSILRKTVSLEKAVCQWGNLAAFVSALYKKDYELLGRSLNDVIVEPVRSILIPYFDQLREVAMENGALGFGISGSGPSVFAMCKAHESANKVGDALKGFYGKKNIEFDLHRSGISVEGIIIQS
ncbi:MAG TPA: homoserine kinase, partial [Salinimicrobium sp.]|nr:homoserine kinase [Salinimicrobium sp.]